MNRHWMVGGVSAIVLGLVAFCAAQMATGGGGQMAENMAENSKKLKQYTYLQKTEVFLKGEARSTKVDQVHYDSSGQKVVVPVSSTPSAEGQQGGGGGRLRQRVVEKKKDEMKDYIERLVGLMGQYLPPNGDRIKAAMPRAQITPPSGGEAKIALPDYLKQGDTMTLSIEPATKALSKILINSSLDEDPVKFTIDFAKLPDGTNYPSMTSIQSPSKELEIRVTTSDYHK